MTTDELLSDTGVDPERLHPLSLLRHSHTSLRTLHLFAWPGNLAPRSTSLPVYSGLSTLIFHPDIISLPVITAQDIAIWTHAFPALERLELRYGHGRIFLRGMSSLTVPAIGSRLEDWDLTLEKARGGHQWHRLKSFKGHDGDIHLLGPTSRLLDLSLVVSRYLISFLPAILAKNRPLSCSLQFQARVDFLDIATLLHLPALDDVRSLDLLFPVFSWPSTPTNNLAPEFYAFLDSVLDALKARTVEDLTLRMFQLRCAPPPTTRVLITTPPAPFDHEKCEPLCIAPHLYKDDPHLAESLCRKTFAGVPSLRRVTVALEWHPFARMRRRPVDGELERIDGDGPPPPVSAPVA
ncbi:uncharacterized protein BXZ73DRAFT_97319 [Epithele typhae]|uniref:uncharacterized protein n=1 Tax=Epithele typhae TaxID=378194 RepID=UPI00200802F5|nr:uncharacterized protein BXZ73DRAFT_97319 [Epithele typhae]KAH9943269.1 hypothetical protein BXZ73DRAFT_97319 [Epithele typhae]